MTLKFMWDFSEIAESLFAFFGLMSRRYTWLYICVRLSPEKVEIF